MPLFQRGYVWTQQGQWEPLWEDILSQAADVVRQRKQPQIRAHKHFLGALVLNLTQTPLSHVQVVEIIDGQQRLTTLQVLLAAIRDEIAHLDLAYANDALNRLTNNAGNLAFPDERYKVWPTGAMHVHVRNVLSAGSAQNVEDYYSQFHVFRYRKWQPPRPAVVEAYLYFARAMRDYLDDDPGELPYELIELSTIDRVQVLVEALLQHFQLVTIELEAEDDAQIIFETLNARGAPLTPSDLVRNFVFLTATRDGHDVTRLYDQYWRAYDEQPLEDPFWRKDERQGRLKRSRLDLFLFHYVTYRLGQSLKIGHSYQAFRDWWESSPQRDVEEELRELLRYSEFYAEMLDPQRASPIGRSLRRLRVLDQATAYPLLLWAAGAFGLNSDEMARILQIIESFIVRRSVCGYDAKAYNNLFLELLEKVRASDNPSPNMLADLLSASSAESRRWPTDAEFRQHLVNDPIYRTVRPGRTQMILEAIEEHSRSAFAEDVAVNSPLTIEHILPQHPSEADWPLYLENSSEWAERWAHRINVAAHQLGNLTLLTQELNSSTSNGPFHKKRPEIAKQSLLSLNTYFQDVETWDEDAILQRGNHLADVALKIWPGPPR